MHLTPPFCTSTDRPEISTVRKGLDRGLRIRLHRKVNNTLNQSFLSTAHSVRSDSLPIHLDHEQRQCRQKQRYAFESLEIMALPGIL
jgi:hypothetical protein